MFSPPLRSAERVTWGRDPSKAEKGPCSIAASDLGRALPEQIFPLGPRRSLFLPSAQPTQWARSGKRGETLRRPFRGLDSDCSALLTTTATPVNRPSFKSAAENRCHKAWYEGERSKDLGPIDPWKKRPLFCLNPPWVGFPTCPTITCPQSPHFPKPWRTR